MKKAWPKVRLGEVLKQVARAEVPIPGKIYRQIGVRLWGEGAYERESIDGGVTKYKELFRTEADDIIVNKIWARNGSVAVVPQSLAGCYGSNEFPMFSPMKDLIDPRWIYWTSKTRDFWIQCDEKSRGTSGKNRIKPEHFLDVEILLPAFIEQRTIAAKIDEITEQVNEVLSSRDAIEKELSELLSGVFWQIVKDAPRFAMGDIAPLIRRHVIVSAFDHFPELGIRSYGKGTFHKPELTGLELKGKRIFKIEPGDLIFSNVFAWEGAIAVAQPADAGRFGSHRFITCVPRLGEATARFLCFYFLTNEGLDLIGAASPGGAGRNRTLGLRALANISVPVPSYETQLRFDALHEEVENIKQIKTGIAAELIALRSAILDRAFNEVLSD